MCLEYMACDLSVFVVLIAVSLACDLLFVSKTKGALVRDSMVCRSLYDCMCVGFDESVSIVSFLFVDFLLMF